MSSSTTARSDRARERTPPPLSWLGVVALMLATTTLPRAAVAQTPAETARAEALFEEGKGLMDQKDYTAACARFEESYALVKGVGAQYFLARCLAELGKTASAYHHFDEVAEISSRAGQHERAQVARERMAELAPKLTKLRLEVTSRTPGLQITCDGKTIPESSWGQALPFDPGHHVVRATLAERPPWSSDVELTTAGTVLTVVVPDLTADSGALPPAGDDRPGDSALPPALLVSGIAVGGLGLAGFAIGAGLAGVAKSTYDDSDAFCDDTGCDQQGLDLVADARSLGDGATAMFVIGGVLLAGGVSMIVVSTLQGDDGGAFRPSVRLGLGHASLSFDF